MADIIFSPATRTTLLQVLRTRALMDATAQRLATGVRASAITNAIAFVNARSLTDRANDLLTVKDKITEAASTVGAAVAAIDSIISLVNQMRGLAVSVKGSAASGPVATTVTGNVVVDASQRVRKALAGAEHGDSFDITHNGTTTTISIGNHTDFDDVVADINAIGGLTATVSNGKPLVITAADGQDIVIANHDNDLATDLGLATSTNGSLGVGTNTLRAAAETQFDSLRIQIDNLVNDTTFLGVNLLKALPDSLTVKFNEDGTTSLTVSGIASDSTALGISAVDSADSFATDAGIDAVIAQLDAALTTLRTTQSTLGGSNTLINIRLTFTENLIDTLENGAANLINANLEEEAANLLALQTRHDLALFALSLSFDNGSAILALLRLR